MTQKSIVEQLKALEAENKASTIEELQLLIGRAYVDNASYKDGKLDIDTDAAWEEIPNELRSALTEPDVTEAVVGYSVMVAAAMKLLSTSPMNEWVAKLEHFPELMVEHKLLMHGAISMLMRQPKGFEPINKPIDDEVDLASQTPLQPQLNPQPQQGEEQMSFNNKVNAAAQGTAEHVKSMLGTASDAASTLGERVAQQAQNAYNAVSEAQVNAPNAPQVFEPREIEVSFTARPQSLKDKALDVAYFLGIGVVLGVGYSAGKRLFEHFVGDGATSDDQAPEVPEAFM